MNKEADQVVGVLYKSSVERFDESLLPQCYFIAFTNFVSCDFWFEALFLWITPFAASFSTAAKATPV